MTANPGLAHIAHDFPIPPKSPAGWSAMAERHTRRWTRMQALTPSRLGGRLAGWVYPYALAGRRHLLADWFSWLFAYTDGTALPDGPSLADLHMRTRRWAPPDWRERFASHTAEPAACGALLTASFDLIELAGNRFLPPAIRDDATYVAVTTAAADVVTHTGHIATLSTEESATARPLLAGCVQDFLRAETVLLDTDVPAADHSTLRHNVSGLRIFMRGYLDWLRESARP